MSRAHLLESADLAAVGVDVSGRRRDVTVEVHLQRDGTSTVLDIHAWRVDSPVADAAVRLAVSLVVGARLLGVTRTSFESREGRLAWVDTERRRR